MLRGPEDGGAPAGPHGCMNMHAPRYSWALSSADGAQHSGVPPAGRSVLLPRSRSSSSSGGSARRGFVGVFAGSCHIQPVSTGPGEAAELLVQREAITGAADIMSVTATDWCSEVQPETRLQLKQNPCKVNPAFEEHLKTIWYYS